MTLTAILVQIKFEDYPAELSNVKFTLLFRIVLAARILSCTSVLSSISFLISAAFRLYLLKNSLLLVSYSLYLNLAHFYDIKRERIEGYLHLMLWLTSPNIST